MGNEGVATVEKALSLLDCFRLGHEEWTLAALAKASGMHRTTVYRLMNSLERMSYVVRSDSGEYSLGPRLLFLGKLYEQSFHLASVVEPVLRMLSDETGESASYYLLENGQRLCLFHADPPAGLRETRLPGTSLPLDNTSSSKVIRYWGRSEPLFEARPSLPFFSTRERDEHTASFAVPIFGEGNKFVAALALGGPAGRMEVAHAESRFDALLLQSASSLSRKLGATTQFCEQMFA